MIAAIVSTMCVYSVSSLLPIRLVSNKPVQLLRLVGVLKIQISHDILSGSDITPCNKIDTPLVVHIFSSVTLLRP